MSIWARRVSYQKGSSGETAGSTSRVFEEGALNKTWFQLSAINTKLNWKTECATQKSAPQHRNQHLSDKFTEDRLIPVLFFVLFFV